MIGIDHEYIAENSANGDVPGERPDVQKVYCEVMQMGACKLDTYRNEVKLLNRIVRPHRIHRIPRWLTKMTGMTEERRATGVSFPHALQELCDLIGDDEDIWTMSGDWWVLEGNAKEHGIPLPFKPFRRLKPLLPHFGISLKEFKRAGYTEVISGGLHKVLGITLPQVVGVGAHDALHDARSLAHSVHYLREIGYLVT